MRIALVGLPQSGKRTLFTLLTGRAVHEGRKPDEAPEGVAPIRDPRVDVMTRICKPQRKVYAENHFVLCPDVQEGTGARVWLDAARRCDLVCGLVRAFSSEEVYHPSGSVDAERDRQFIESELLLADMQTAEVRLERLGKQARVGLRPEQQIEQKAIEKCLGALEAGRALREEAFTPPEAAAIRSLGFVSRLPVLWAYNVDETALESAPAPGTVMFSCRIEAEIAAMDDASEREEYLASIGLASSGVDRMNAAAYDALGLMSFYTVGKDEVRAWTVRKGAPAPEAAGRVHSDMERGFIRVEIIKYDDLVEAGSEQAVKAAGKAQLKGKDYAIEDGDVCHFLFNV